MEDYFGILKELTALFEEVYNYYLYVKTSQPETDIDQFTTAVDYDDEIKNVLDMLQYLTILKNAPKYARLSKERWLEYIAASASGSDYFVRVTIPYTVKDYEDIQAIADKFNVDWQEILTTNGLKSSEIVGGLVINIPQLKKYNLDEINIEVFGTQDGESAFGSDLTNFLEEDYIGDLKLI